MALLVLPAQSPKSNSLVFTIASGVAVFEQDVPGAVQTVGLTEEGCAGGCQRVFGQGRSLAEWLCRGMRHLSPDVLLYVGMKCIAWDLLLLLLDAARDADEEMPQDSGCMKLNWLSD